MIPSELVAREREQLALLERASEAIAQAQSIEAVLELRDQASALKAYAEKKKGGEKAVQEAKKFLLRIQRRLGEFTRGLPRAKGAGRGRGKEASPGEVCKREALGALGLSEKDAHVCESLAAIPERRFEAEVVKPEANAKSLARVGAEYRRPEKAPLRSAPVPAPRPAVSDRILEQRALMFRVAVEKVLRKHLERWPSNASTAPLARVLVEVSNTVKELQS